MTLQLLHVVAFSRARGCSNRSVQPLGSKRSTQFTRLLASVGSERFTLQPSMQLFGAIDLLRAQPHSRVPLPASPLTRPSRPDAFGNTDGRLPEPESEFLVKSPCR